jgi:hypothetical protein
MSYRRLIYGRGTEQLLMAVQKWGLGLTFPELSR